MTHHLDSLSHPPVDGLAPREREYLAYEPTVVAAAAGERADILRASGHRGVELAVVELTAFVESVQRRATRYQPTERGIRP